MVNNIKVMNMIRATTSEDYQNRIPVATKDNISKVGTLITEYPTARNEFVEALTNQVTKTLFYTKVMTNKLKMFNKGMLPFGKSIQMLMADVIKGRTFKEANKDQLTMLDIKYGKHAPNIKAQYITENYQHLYVITISDAQLKGAFRDEFGLNSLVAQAIQSQLNSAEVDMFLMAWALINDAKYKEILTVRPVDGATSKKFTIDMKETIELMDFPTSNYNNQGVTTQTKIEDLVIIMTPKTKGTLDVELLATAFHMEKADILAKVLMIPSFDDPNCVALIVDKDFLQIWDTENAVETERNKVSLSYNQILHKWGIMAQCDFVNAVKLTTTLTPAPQEVKSDDYEGHEDPIGEQGERDIPDEDKERSTKTLADFMQSQ